MPIPIIGLHRHYYEKRKAKQKISWPSGLDLIHKHWGVSWIHLEHEFILLISSVFLIASSMMSLYTQTFPKVADLQYILMTVIWLARYPIHRMICTTDTNCTRYGAKDGWKIFHVLSTRFQWFWILATSGGQFYDVPATFLKFSDGASSFISSCAKGEEIRSDDNIERMNRSSPLKKFPLHILCLIISILKWIFHIVRGKTSKKINHVNTTSGKTSHKASEQNGEESFLQLYHIQLKEIEHVMINYRTYLPDIQKIIFITSLMVFSSHVYRHYMIWFLHVNKLRTTNGFLDYLSSDDRFKWIHQNFNIFTQKLISNYSGNANSLVQQVYCRSSVFMTIIMIGSFGSLLIFGRIILPLPDLVNNSQDDVRSKSSKKRNEVPWCENYRSIMNTDRFLLHTTVSLLRVVEYFLLCFVLPRSEYICKATGHCEIGISIYELGSLAIKGHRGRSMYDRLIYDVPMGWLIGFVTILIPSLVFLSTIILLDRSRLAMNAFLQQEEPKGMRRSSISKKSGHTEDFDFSEFLLSNAEANKGGIFSTLKHSIHHVKSSVYKFFADEVGPVATSRIVSICSTIHLVMSTSIMILFIFYYVSNRYWYPLILVYLSFFISAPDPGSLDYSSLRTYADHISASQKMMSQEVLLNETARGKRAVK